jgi:hypothetical protein
VAQQLLVEQLLVLAVIVAVTVDGPVLVMTTATTVSATTGPICSLMLAA